MNEDFIEKLLEPLDYYNEIKPYFKENVESFFNQLVEKSKIDVELNKKLVNEYEELSTQKNNLMKKINNYKFLGIFLVFLFIVLGCISYYFYTKNIIQSCSIYGILSFLSILLRVTFVAKNLKSLTTIYEEFQQKCDEKLDECYLSIYDLNVLMDSKYTFDIINKYIPFIKFDTNFNINRFGQLCQKYDFFINESKNYSTLEVASGDILGNPFVLFKELNHSIVQHTYTGSLRISWKEYYTDSQGNSKSRTRSQTLRASIKKPKPVYEDVISLIMANDVAPNLNFSRVPSYIHTLKEKEISKKVKKEEKKLKKLEEKSIKNGGSFTMMANSEFEVLFNALDRDNEAEFRLLFTPLAQTNMIKLLKNKEYGDNFIFNKMKKINYVQAEHTKDWDLDFKADKFKNYSYEKSREFFINFNTKFFDNFFFNIAPLISIPLYQQYMSDDYIYGKELNYNYNPYLAEVIANDLGKEYLTHENTKTPAILKATPLQKKGKNDLVNIRAYSYDIIEKVQYVSVLGGDGYYHDVPVYWDDYIPLVKNSTLELKELQLSDQEIKDFRRDYEFLQRDNCTYKNKIFGKVTNNNFEIDKFFNNFK